MILGIQCENAKYSVHIFGFTFYLFFKNSWAELIFFDKFFRI